MRFFDQFKSTASKLKSQTITTQTIQVAVKKPAYHEVIVNEEGATYRVYDRATSAVLSEGTELTLVAAQAAALRALATYNGEG